MKRNTPSLIDVSKTFGTEENCLAYLEVARWPEGVRCLKCDSDKVSKFTTNETTRERFSKKLGKLVEVRVPARSLYQCNAEGCRHQFSATTGTIFNDTHLPLSKWFMAVAIMCNAKKGVSAKQMERDLGVNYRTAWYLCHRIREAMQSEQGLFGENGTVEMDETFVGGRYDARRKRERYDKQAVMGVLQRAADQPSQVQAFLIPNRGNEVIRNTVNERVAPSAKIMTDEWSGYRQLNKTHEHAIVIHTSGEYVRGDVHTNGIEGLWSLVKRQIIGQHHFVSVKHLQRYLNEVCFKFNNREAEGLFAAVLINLVIANALPYTKLIEKPEASASSEPSAS